MSIGAFLGSLLGGGGGGGEITNTASSASDVDVEVNPVILNEIDMSSIDRLALGLQQAATASQERSEAALERVTTQFADAIRFAGAAGLAYLILRRN